MNKQLFLAILLFYGSDYIKSNTVQQLEMNPQTSLSISSNKRNHSYWPPLARKDREIATDELKTTISKVNLNYKHNQPKAIDDPLPKRVDHLPPLHIDSVNQQYRPIYKGALISSLFFDVYGKEPFTAAHYHAAKNNDSSKIQTVGKDTTAARKDYIKAEGTSESKQFFRDPVVPINYFHHPSTELKLFNHDDDFKLSGSAPEVIFKPGDDITFSKDTTVIDDYEYNFSIDDWNQGKISSKSSVNNKESKKNIKATKATAKSVLHTKAIDDSHSTAATQHVEKLEKSESIHTDHGYFYDKPKIPFTF